MHILIDNDVNRADQLQDVLAAHGHQCVVLNTVDSSNFTLLQASSLVMVHEDCMEALRLIVGGANDWDARKVLLVLRGLDTADGSLVEKGAQDIAWLVADLKVTPAAPSSLIAVLDLLVRQPELCVAPARPPVGPKHSRELLLHHSGGNRAA